MGSAVPVPGSSARMDTQKLLLGEARRRRGAQVPRPGQEDGGLATAPAGRKTGHGAALCIHAFELSDRHLWSSLSLRGQGRSSKELGTGTMQQGGDTVRQHR